MTDNAQLAKRLRCSSPSDLFMDTARLLIYRLCKPWLEEKKVSVAELLHSKVHQNKFSNAGAFYSNAVQKTAVMQVEGTKLSVQDRVKELYALCDAILAMVNENAFGEKKAPSLQPTQFHAFVEQVTSAIPDAAEMEIRKAVAALLSETEDWDAKLLTLMQMIASAKAPDLSLLDPFIADILMSGGALRGLMGEAQSLFHRMEELIQIYKGTFKNPEIPMAMAISQCIKHLPATRFVLADHLKNTLEQRAPLLSDALDEELQALSTILAQMNIDGQYIGGQDVEDIIAMRASWLVTHESVGEFLKGVKDRQERAFKLVTIYPLTPGAKNRQFVLRYLEDLISEWAERADARTEEEPTFETFRVLGRISYILSQQDIADNRREKLTQQFESIYKSLQAKFPLLQHLENDIDEFYPRGFMLLDLLADHAFRNEDTAAAARTAKDYLRDPKLLQLYATNGTAPPAQKKQNLVEIVKALQAAG